MKYIFSIFLVSMSYFSYGQITVSEMMRVYEMDYDQFETFALSKNFELDKVKKDENIDGYVYIKNRGLYPNYLEFDIYDRNYGKMVSFQTSINSEFLSLKIQLENLGFKLVNSNLPLIVGNESSFARLYKNAKWKIYISHAKLNDINCYRVDLQKIL
jgi:hypothetical protein